MASELCHPRERELGHSYTSSRESRPRAVGIEVTCQDFRRSLHIEMGRLAGATEVTRPQEPGWGLDGRPPS